MLIDCDVHHNRAHDSDIAKYLPEPWRSEILKYGERKLESGILTQLGGMRWDSVPPNGGRPGSDYEFMKEQLLDKYGHTYAILTGTGNTGGVPDPDYAAAVVSAYNDYTINEWLPKDKRFKTVIVVALQDPLLAAREIDRLGDHPDVVMVWVTIATNIPFGHRYYYPIYEAAERKGLPIGIHPCQGGMMFAQASPTGAGVPRTYAEWHTGVSQVYMGHLTSILLEGVFERFPRLKFVFVECGFSWLPHLLWRLDSHYKGLRQEAPLLKRLPSEYVRDHIRFTTQPMEEPKNPKHLMDMFEMIDGENMLMYASDYPHWDFDEPSVLPGKLSESAKRKILYENARDFFNLK